MTRRLRMGPGRIAALALVGIASVASGACATPKPIDVTAPSTDAGPAEPLLQPAFGPTQTSAVEPPAMSGGTLLVTQSGSFAVAADPDRDAIYVVDLGSSTSRTIRLQAGDEPGRLAEDGAGHVHVALRSGGALVTVDPQSATLLDRRPVCPAPRGLAWEAATDLVWVACATGELVAMPAAGGAAAKQFVLERDLRDVVVTGDGIAVSQFRSARVLHVDATGSVSRVDTLPPATRGFASHVMWRAAAGPSGTIYTVHQEESLSSLSTGKLGSGDLVVPKGAGQGPGQGGYGVGVSATCGDGGDVAVALGDDAGPASAQCAINGLPPVDLEIGPFGDAGVFIPDTCTPISGAVHSVLTGMDQAGNVIENEVLFGVLPVDLAVSPDGSSLAVALPGDAYLDGVPTVIELSRVLPCAGSLERAFSLAGDGNKGQPVAVAFASAGTLLVQTREPAQIWAIDESSGSQSPIMLSDVSRHDTGYDVFHSQAGGMIACASCHPEGRDDGHVWTLDGSPRRTPSLAGTIAGTAPYHWPGDMKDMTALVDDVYTVRMSGAKLAADQMRALSRWVQDRPAPPAPSWLDTAATARGEALFESASVGCTGCHAGPKLTDNTTRDIGSGGAFQVPPLTGVGWRTPLLHDGCAATIADRFGQCATPGHGNIAGLSPGQMADLGMYLEGL